ncbi:hypothetical protein N802_19130 [Knoellia sinensis KCTC 19936]|uniref:Uncharacterized protein n=1 Tax=Knoellia sinensis KCTC 19936 TaxID=1385520 RepID=A0A0A0J8L1_9MICO|nr:hypothetical protein [Knoellia sinensis]KGN31956.1 hypothetical protein N802_19130 [Knoellia sinensis KCTC 19936]
MTTQWAPTLPRQPVDLRAAHEQAVRTARRAFWPWVLGVNVVPAVAIGVGQAGARSDVRAGALWGLTALLTVAAVGVVAVLINRRAVRAAAGPASPGSSSFGQAMSKAPGPAIWTSIHAPLVAEGFRAFRLIDTHTLEATTWRHGGRHDITIQVVAHGDSAGLVTVWARAGECPWFGPAVDYGRNRKFANAVLNAVPEATPVV